MVSLAFLLMFFSLFLASNFEKDASVFLSGASRHETSRLYLNKIVAGDRELKIEQKPALFSFATTKAV